MNDTTQYDLLIIGAGPGGYVAAARAAQLGMKTAIVDKNERLGGVCLNIGCIPSKALLDSSEHVATAKKEFDVHGIRTGGIEVDLGVMMKRKESVVVDLTDNVRKLLDAGRVEIIQGTARLKNKEEVAVETAAGNQTIAPKNILLATGSRPAEPAGMAFDGEVIVSSTEALSFETIPERMVIVGGGSIGLELGSVWSRLGTKVTIVEMLPNIAGRMDGEMSRRLLRVLKKQGIEFRLGMRVTGVDRQNGGAQVSVEDEKGNAETLLCDKVLVSVGRQALTEGLGLEETGVSLTEQGFVAVDRNYHTGAGNIYAIGDLIGGWMLAHEASAEGKAAVQIMAGKYGAVNYDAMPNIVYTSPEAAAVGMTEEMLKQKEIPYCKGTYPLTGAGRARCMGRTDGLVKVLSHGQTDRLLGVHILSPGASDMIMEACLALEFGAASEDIGSTVHGHPTFAEALQEAALAARECSIYGP